MSNSKRHNGRNHVSSHDPAVGGSGKAVRQVRRAGPGAMPERARGSAPPHLAKVDVGALRGLVTFGCFKNT